MNSLYEQARIAVHDVWRRRWVALGVTQGVCMLGWLALTFIPNGYQSKARVLFDAQSQIPSATVMPTDRQSDLLRVRQSVTSGANLEKVVRGSDLGTLVSNDDDMAQRIGELRAGLNVTPALDNPNLFEISATASFGGLSDAQNARVAQATVTTLLDLLMSDGVAGDRATTGKTLGLLDDELKRLEVRLQDAEQRRVDFEQKFLGLLPGEGSLGSRMTAARTELASIDQQLMVAQGSLSTLRSQMAGTPANLVTPGGGVGNAAATQIAALEAQLAQSASRGWTDQHPDVVAVRQQIQRLRPQARTDGGGGSAMANPAYSSLRMLAAEREAQVAAAMTRKAQLQAGIAELDSRQTAEPGVVAEQARLNRDYDVLKRQYDKLLEDREQVRLRGDVQTTGGQLRVIDGASWPTVPATPNRPLLLTGILFLGLAIGIGVAFVLGQVRTTFPTQGRLEQASGLPVLGSISEVLSDAQRALARKRLRIFAATGGGLVLGYALLMGIEFWQRSTVA